MVHLEFTNKDFSELDAFADFPKDKVLGVRRGGREEHDGRVGGADRRPDPPLRSRWCPADRLLVSPDCGLGYFSRTTAYAKLRNMGQAADEVRKAL